MIIAIVVEKQHNKMEFWRSGNGGDPGIDGGSLKKANSFNVYPVTVVATASAGTSLARNLTKNYEFFNVAQTSLSTDKVILPDCPVGTVLHFYAISACAIKAGADGSGLTINGGADTASLSLGATQLARFQKTTSTNWVASILSAAASSVSQSLTSPVFVSSPTGDGVTQWAEVSITAAEIKAIRATPKTLVAAPGAGKILEFVSLQLFLDYGGSNVFTEAGNNLAVKFTDGSGAAVSQTVEMTGFIDQSADTVTNGLPKIDAIVAKSGSENKALVLHNTSGAEIAGNAANDNVVRAKVAYRVWSTGF